MRVSKSKAVSELNCSIKKEIVKLELSENGNIGTG